MSEKEQARFTVVDGPIAPAMLQALGRMTVAFQNMEAQLKHTIWRVADLGGQSAAIVTSGLTTKALHARVASLLRYHWVEVWEQRGRALLNRIDSLTNERNTLVHSLWYATDSEEGAVRYRATANAGQGIKHSFAAVPLATVEGLADRMADAAAELQALGAELYPDYVQRHLRAEVPHSIRGAAKAGFVPPE
jgi:hypothetical protein